MTEELQAIIEAITCTFCAGEGHLVSRVVHTPVFGDVPVIHDTDRKCPQCHGFGIATLEGRI